MSFWEYIESVDNVARFRKILSKDLNTIGGLKRYYGTWTNSGFEDLELFSVTSLSNTFPISYNGRWDPLDTESF